MLYPSELEKIKTVFLRKADEYNKMGFSDNIIKKVLAGALKTDFAVAKTITSQYRLEHRVETNVFVITNSGYKKATAELIPELCGVDVEKWQTNEIEVDVANMPLLVVLGESGRNRQQTTIHVPFYHDYAWVEDCGGIDLYVMQYIPVSEYKQDGSGRHFFEPIEKSDKTYIIGKHLQAHRSYVTYVAGENTSIITAGKCADGDAGRMSSRQEPLIEVVGNGKFWIKSHGRTSYEIEVNVQIDENGKRTITQEEITEQEKGVYNE